MILVDDRERPSGICDELEKLNIPYKTHRLDVGDYVINDTIYVERKTSSDFLESLDDMRLFAQVSRLRADNKRAVLLIEGSRLSGRPSVRAALCSIAVQWYMPVLRSRDIEGTAWFLCRMHEYKQHHSLPHHQYDFRTKRGIASLEVRMLTQLRNVGPEMARLLLKRFGSLGGVINAKKGELMEVEGVREFIAGQVLLLRGGGN